MVFKLTKIDDLTRGDHYHLSPDDECYYFGEYTSRKGYAFSETNQLVSNFKKPLSKKGTSQWVHKERAIESVGVLFGRLHITDGFVLIPAPPSKASDSPEYDDRMYQALRGGCPNADVRKLVVQQGSRQSAHLAGDGERPTISSLLQRYRIDETLSEPVPKVALICDDVITCGTTFKAMQFLLRQRYPDVTVAGIFVARRVWGADDLLLF